MVVALSESYVSQSYYMLVLSIMRCASPFYIVRSVYGCICTCVGTFIAWLQAVPLMLHALYLSHMNTYMYMPYAHARRPRARSRTVYTGQILPVLMRSLGARL